MLNIGLKNMSNNPPVTADRNRIFKSSNDFSMHIEQIVRDKKISYMDAVLQYCKENFIEPEDVAKLVNKSLKDKLEVNFQDENYLPKRAKLDV
jgi:KaiC/GvpD/RAD55 family RecA-like ATPase